MEGYIKWSDLALVVIMVSVVTVSFYLVLLIRNLNKSIKLMKNVIQTNKENIEETLKNMPLISKNLVEVTDTAKNELKSVESAIHSIGETIQYTAATAETVKNDILGNFKSILDIIELIKRLFFKDKKKEDFQKDRSESNE